MSTIYESELVTGDIVKIRDGMDIPADMLLLEGNDIITDESAWTGEHESVKKKIYRDCLTKRDEIIANGDQDKMGYYNSYSPILLSGTNVRNGEGKAIVLVVGESAAFAQIRKYMVEEVELTPLEERLQKLSDRAEKLGVIAGIIIYVILLIRFLVDRANTDTFDTGQYYIQLVEFALIAVTVYLVAIPESLVATYSLSLVYYVKEMIYNNNLVTNLSAIETMGTVNTICTAKIGTLTQNKLYLTHFWNDKHIPIDPHEKKTLSAYFKGESLELIRQAFACNNSAYLDPYDVTNIDIALLEFLEKNGEDYKAIRERYLTKDSLRFPTSYYRKRMSTVLENVENGKTSKKRMHIKGIVIFEGGLNH